MYFFFKCQSLKLSPEGGPPPTLKNLWSTLCQAFSTWTANIHYYKQTVRKSHIAWEKLYLIFVMGMQVSLSIVSYSCLFLQRIRRVYIIKENGWGRCLNGKELFKMTHLKATDSRMARTRWLLVVEGLRPIKEAQALGSLRGAFGQIRIIHNKWKTDLI